MKTVEAGAHLKENVESVTCRNCKTELVITKSDKRVTRTICQCPKCGAGITYIWD